MRKRILAIAVIGAIFSVLLLAGAAAAPERPAIRLPIVMYHHVSVSPSRWNAYVISPEELESDLQWLRAHGYETVSIAELLDWAEGKGALPGKPCMITFDDGFESTAAYAEPLLQSYGFCGAVAVIGSVCEQFSALEEHDAELSNLSWEDARGMAERGVIEVQCHTWDLHGLRDRSGCCQRKGEPTEVYRSALSADLSRFLTAARAHAVPLAMTIAYPYGSYNRETTRAVQDMGFRAAFTCTETVNCLTGAEEELYHLGRYNRPHGVSSEKFFAIWEENS